MTDFETRERELDAGIRSTALKVIVQSQVPASPIAKQPGGVDKPDGPPVGGDPVGRAQRRLDGIRRIPDVRRRVELKTEIHDELAVEARATKSMVKRGRDFGKPEDRLWAGQWMHEHTVVEFVELYGVPKQTAYRWRDDYRKRMRLAR